MKIKAVLLGLTLSCSTVFAEQVPVSPIVLPTSGTINLLKYTNNYVNPVLAAIQNNNTQLFAALSTRHWVVSVTAPIDKTYLWFDISDSLNPTLKFNYLDTWTSIAGGLGSGVSEDTLKALISSMVGGGNNTGLTATFNSVTGKIDFNVTATGSTFPAWLPSSGPTNARQILQAVGGCSDTQYSTESTCTSNAGTWTIPRYENTTVIEGIIDDTSHAEDGVISAKAVDDRVKAVGDTKQPLNAALTAASQTAADSTFFGKSGGVFGYYPVPTGTGSTSNVTVSTSLPTGGVNGDIWYMVEP